MADLLLMLGVGLIIGSPIIGLGLGLSLREEKGSGKDWYLVVVGWCFGLAGLFIVSSIFVRENSPLEIYDVEIRIHYVDGYSKTIRKDSITYEELPEIEEGYRYTGNPVYGGRREYLGTYSLYFGGERYNGVIRYEYLKKRSYSVNYVEYFEKRRNQKCK